MLLADSQGLCAAAIFSLVVGGRCESTKFWGEFLVSPHLGVYGVGFGPRIYRSGCLHQFESQSQAPTTAPTPSRKPYPGDDVRTPTGAAVFGSNPD